MTGQELLERLLKSYASSFDIERPYEVNGNLYEAHAVFDVTSAKYVLVKKAELWRAKCFEHTFFRVFGAEMGETEVQRFREDIVSQIEPQLVRGGEKYPVQDHMYTYITGIFICENGVTGEARRAVKKFRFFKNYLLSIRGYAEARILVFDLKEKKVFGNRAARELVKGYKKYRKSI